MAAVLEGRELMAGAQSMAAARTPLSDAQGNPQCAPQTSHEIIGAVMATSAAPGLA
ncbi:hypothetical protein [Nocardia suismassiliense]|uniref:hypothetical protein n=1 Tax=Nocardia suismassiliense TaxID=2077092 RepID=UPI00131F1549|nr:hypothetical protein [Nocardia suismassiliense]